MPIIEKAYDGSQVIFAILGGLPMQGELAGKQLDDLRFEDYRISHSYGDVSYLSIPERRLPTRQFIVLTEKLVSLPPGQALVDNSSEDNIPQETLIRGYAHITQDIEMSTTRIKVSPAEQYTSITSYLSILSTIPSYDPGFLDFTQCLKDCPPDGIQSIALKLFPRVTLFFKWLKYLETLPTQCEEFDPEINRYYSAALSLVRGRVGELLVRNNTYLSELVAVAKENFRLGLPSAITPAHRWLVLNYNLQQFPPDPILDMVAGWRTLSAPVDKPMKDCPLCANSIPAKAILCSHCGNRIDVDLSETIPNTGKKK